MSPVFRCEVNVPFVFRFQEHGVSSKHFFFKNISNKYLLLQLIIILYIYLYLFYYFLIKDFVYNVRK